MPIVINFLTPFAIFVFQMKGILDANGVVYSRVILRSVYIASVAVTFQVDLVEEDQRSNISQLSSYVSSSESFSTFSNYSVMEDGRGSVDVTVAGITDNNRQKQGGTRDTCRPPLKSSLTLSVKSVITYSSYSMAWDPHPR